MFLTFIGLNFEQIRTLFYFRTRKETYVIQDDSFWGSDFIYFVIEAGEALIGTCHLFCPEDFRKSGVLSFSSRVAKEKFLRVPGNFPQRPTYFLTFTGASRNLPGC